MDDSINGVTWAAPPPPDMGDPWTAFWAGPILDNPKAFWPSLHLDNPEDDEVIGRMKKRLGSKPAKRKEARRDAGEETP